MPEITKNVVEGEAPSTKERFIWDSEVNGFGLKIFPTGVKTFVFQYRAPDGKTRRLTIGKWSETLTPDRARKTAKSYYRDVLNGKDPQTEKRAARHGLTVNDLLDAYLASSAFAQKADSTKAVDIGRINRHLRPMLGNEAAAALTPDAVLEAKRAIAVGKTAGVVKTKPRGQARIKGGDGTAAKAILALGVAYNWAIEQKLMKTNPAAKLGNWKSGERSAVIEGSDQYAKLFETLQKMQDEKRIRDAVADAIRLIGLTGARQGEIKNLLWKYVDLKAGEIRLPPRAHKTGGRTGRPRIIALPSLAQAIIARQPDGKPDDYVFQPAKGEGPISLGHPWEKVRAEADLPKDLGLHGLRHSIATHLAMKGASVVELMEIMGHRQTSTLIRYIHFAEKARSTLAERAAEIVTAGFNTASAEVVPIKKGRKP